MTRAACMALLFLSGCTLIDQRTFDPHAGEAPVVAQPKPPAPPPVPGPPPLVVIAPDATDYAAALAQVVAQARARKPGVVFDVVELQRPDAPATDALGQRAAAVAEVIRAQGVDAAHIRLAARPDAAARAGEVRVFVR